MSAWHFSFAMHRLPSRRMLRGMPIDEGAVGSVSGGDSRSTQVATGDVVSCRESGRLLAGIAALAFICPWVLFGDEIASESLTEITGASVVFAVHSVFSLVLLMWALLRRSSARHHNDYWIVTGAVAFSMVGSGHQG